MILQILYYFSNLNSVQNWCQCLQHLLNSFSLKGTNTVLYRKVNCYLFCCKRDKSLFSFTEVKCIQIERSTVLKNNGIKKRCKRVISDSKHVSFYAKGTAAAKLSHRFMFTCYTNLLKWKYSTVRHILCYYIHFTHHILINKCYHYGNTTQSFRAIP